MFFGALLSTCKDTLPVSVVVGCFTLSAWLGCFLEHCCLLVRTLPVSVVVGCFTLSAWLGCFWSTVVYL